MINSFERHIAFRYLRARREEGLISVIALFSLIGIALGVATLIVVLSVMNGVRGELIKSIIGLEGHITVHSQNIGLSSYDSLVEELEQMPGVKVALPKVDGQVMVTHGGYSNGAMVSAFPAQALDKKPLLTDRIDRHALDALKAGDGVVIGSRMAERMGIRTGDEITLISPQGQATIAGMVPRVKSYPVVGTFTIGMFAYDNNLILLPFEQAQRYFKLYSEENTQVTGLEVMAHDVDESGNIARAIAMKHPDLRVFEWKSSNNHIFQAVLVQRNVMFLILMLIIVVAAFNIISSLIMLVREKNRDIAILRTMGATPGSVLRIFMLAGASVGVLGTALGVILGLLIAYNTESIQFWLEGMMGHRLFADELYFLSHLPSKVDLSEVLTVVAMSLVVSLLATLYPARKAAKLNPVEGLHHD